MLNEEAVSYGEMLAQQQNTDQAESVFSKIITRLNRSFAPNQQGYTLPQIDPFAMRAMSGLLKIYRDNGRTQAANELLAKMKHWKMNTSVTSRRDHAPPVPELNYPLLPGSIDSTDMDQLKKHLQTTVTVQGQIVDVELTAKKNAINLVLDGEEHTCVLIWISPANFKSLNAAYSGDIGTALLGKVVEVKGTLIPFGGTGLAWAQRLEIPVTKAGQIHVISASPPQTQPANVTGPQG